jgi:prepilin-type N-terminal cleavage/methylation domain-containing protein
MSFLNDKKHRKSGFTLIELIIVIGILGVLAGVAVPYYQDYVFDARLNALKSNMATLRRALEEFRGDHGRGPYRGVVYYNAGAWGQDCTFSDPSKNELTAGSVPTHDNYMAGHDFRGGKYLTNYPLLEDPSTGELLSLKFSAGSANLYYIDNAAVGQFDLDTDPQFLDLKQNGSFDTDIDTVKLGDPSVGDPLPADVASLWVLDSRGNMY